MSFQVSYDSKQIGDSENYFAIVVRLKKAPHNMEVASLMSAIETIEEICGVKVQNTVPVIDIGEKSLEVIPAPEIDVPTFSRRKIK